MEQRVQIHKALIREVRRRLFEESVPRLKKCLNILSEEEIWYRPNENVVSVGNLVLHLCGNVNQWLLSTLGDEPDTRVRQKEFDEPGPIPTAKLISDMDVIMGKVNNLLEDLQPGVLLEPKKVQSFEESGLTACLGLGIHPVGPGLRPVPILVDNAKRIDVELRQGLKVSDETRDQFQDFCAELNGICLSLTDNSISSRCGYRSDDTIVLKATGGPDTLAISYSLRQLNVDCNRLLSQVREAKQ